MKSVNSCCVKQALAVAVMAACASLSAQAGEPGSVDKSVLAQVMALNGLDERGAIERLAAEEAAADLYRRVRTMSLPEYAGAWFDADSGKLHVALSDSAQAELLTRFGAVPVAVGWSLRELEDLRESIGADAALLQSGLLRSLHVDYVRNRLAVGAAPGRMEEVRTQLSRYADRIDIYEAMKTLVPSADVRGADGTRNYDFEQLPYGGGYYPCSVGAAVENGFYTVGHCGEAGHDIRWAATYASLGDVQVSAYPSRTDIDEDVGWVSLDSGWTPVPKINGYSDGGINVPAKWAGTNELPLYTHACRYGQTSGGPHCGKIIAKGQLTDWGFPKKVANVTVVEGSCSTGGDSGGTWLPASGSNQVQGTTIGRTEGNDCPNIIPPRKDSFTYFQPISDHVFAYSKHLTKPAGSLLTAHGTAAPTVTGFLCPDMMHSGSGTFICSLDPYSSQGKTDASWSGASFSLTSDDFALGTCSAFDMISVTLTVTNPYGTYTATSSTFPCPMGPIP